MLGHEVTLPPRLAQSTGRPRLAQSPAKSYLLAVPLLDVADRPYCRRAELQLASTTLIGI